MGLPRGEFMQFAGRDWVLLGVTLGDQAIVVEVVSSKMHFRRNSRKWKILELGSVHSRMTKSTTKPNR